MTVSQIQEALTAEYEKYLQNPWLVVEILEYRSQPIYLLGEFRDPTTHYMDRPIRLAQALTKANGFNDKADLRGARVLRDGKVVAVDIYRLLYEGDMSQNTWLKPNDTLFIPSNAEQRVIVLGDVAKPGPVLMKHGQLMLTEAFAAAGDTKRIGTALRYVRVIRSLSPTRGELIVIDYYQILRGQAMDFPLMAGDIVIVPRTGLGKWNDTIQEVLPSLRLVSALLQPFALIRVMVDDDNNN
jgi:polysaccharide export outer membrane protein